MIKIGIAGFGWISQHIHMPTFTHIDGVKVTAIYDLEYCHAEEYLKKNRLLDVKVYTNLEAFINSDVDAIIVAAPNAFHGDLAIEALKADKHVLCEKPLTITLEEFDRIAEVEKYSKGIFFPAYVNRFREDIGSFMSMIAASKIGKIRQVNVSWVRNKGLPRPGTWFTNKRYSGGGVLMDLGPHMIDLGIQFVKDKRIRESHLESWYDIEDYLSFESNWFNADIERKMKIDVERAASGMLQFEEAQMRVNLSWASDLEGDLTHLCVAGENGVCEIKTLLGLSENRFFKEGEIILTEAGEVTRRTFKMDKQLALDAFRRMSEAFVHAIQAPKEEYQDFSSHRFVVESIQSLYENEASAKGQFEDCVVHCYE